VQPERPRLDPADRQQPAWRPWILGDTSTGLGLVAGLHDMDGLTSSVLSQRSRVEGSAARSSHWHSASARMAYAEERVSQTVRLDAVQGTWLRRHAHLDNEERAPDILYVEDGECGGQT
jgi:hypothetical protein